MKDKIVLSLYKNDHEVANRDNELVMINILGTLYLGGTLQDLNQGQELYCVSAPNQKQNTFSMIEKIYLANKGNKTFL